MVTIYSMWVGGLTGDSLANGLFWPAFVVLSYAWWLIPIIGIAAAAGMVVIERASGNEGLTVRPAWPYVVMVLVALVGILVNVMGVLSTSGLEDIYRVVGDDSAYEDLAFGQSPNYFWDGPSPIQIACIACSVITLAAAIACIAIRTSSNARDRNCQAPAPIGQTTDGQPIYPIVGYTPDGQPVTADRAVGLRPNATGTNSMAIVALITSLTVAPLGIVFGHIALSQIKQTGQDGRGMAIAGLVLGYVTVVAWIVIVASIVLSN